MIEKFIIKTVEDVKKIYKDFAIGKQHHIHDDCWSDFLERTKMVMYKPEWYKHAKGQFSKEYPSDNEMWEKDLANKESWVLSEIEETKLFDKIISKYKYLKDGYDDDSAYYFIPKEPISINIEDGFMWVEGMPKELGIDADEENKYEI